MKKLLLYMLGCFLTGTLAIAATLFIFVNLYPVPTKLSKAQLDISINESIVNMIRAGKSEEVYSFYDKFTGDRKLTFLIISNAIVNSIPVNYFFALGYTESRFNVFEVGKNVDKDGNVWSYDYGVFQLNSMTFKEYQKDFLMNPENNIRMAAQFLRSRYDKYGNWYEAIISYNAGGTELIKNITVKHLVSVLSVHEDLDGKFEKEF